MSLLIFITLFVPLQVANAAPKATTEAHADQRILPMALLRGAAGQRFSVIIDGQHRGVLDGEMPLTDLAQGEHTVELRTENNLVIWARGTLTLTEGEELILHVAEGRSITVEGRQGAWKPATAGTTRPRKAARSEDG